MSLNSFFFLSFFTILYISNITVLTAIPVISEAEAEADPADLNTKTLSPTATLPASPEQSNIASCPLNIQEQLYKGISSSCMTNGLSGDQVNLTHCCPVLAAWLYSAYSRTAIHKAIAKFPYSTNKSIDMPVLPDDSETCVVSFEKALRNKGIELVKVNESCDFVYCYCGIRLHPFNCPDEFLVNSHGELVGSESVKRLENDCLRSNGYSNGLAGCSKCLNSLYSLSGGRLQNTTILNDRSSKMHSRDCQMMGLTWLLNKNTSGYIHTVSAVLRTLMMSKDGSNPQSCTLDSDGLPLAVDSSAINDQSSATVFLASVYCYIIPFVVAYINFIAMFSTY